MDSLPDFMRQKFGILQHKITRNSTSRIEIFNMDVPLLVKENILRDVIRFNSVSDI